MKLAIIAAVARNRVIGRNGKLPWHISDDLKRFKKLTTGHTVLMGRKTLASLGKPLPNRRNVVVTSKYLPGIETYSTIEAALDALRTEELVFVIGGGELFAKLLEQADFLFLTLVEATPEGDTLFPEYEHLIGGPFVETAREVHEGFSFVDYRRVDDLQASRRQR